MENAELIRRCHEIVAEANLPATDLGTATALDFFDTTREVLKTWTKERRDSTPWLKDFVLSLRKLRDDFEEEVRRDPACLYQPQHHVAVEFHRSLAKVRYFYGGNRISKTIAGIIDSYWVLTRQHPYRPLPPIGSSVALIATDFKNYASKVFEPKIIRGEAGNPISPLFPEDGKYFNHYDDRKHILKVACSECVAKKRPKLCRHPKAQFSLFSNNEDVVVIAGAQYATVHFDEQVDERFFAESLERTKTIKNSGIVVTETPVFGKAWWTYEKLYKIGTSPERNRIAGTNKSFVSLHTIDQYAAGLVAHEDIEASKIGYTEAEIRARIYGEHVADNERQVFDGNELTKMRDVAKAPAQGYLTIRQELIGKKPEEWALMDPKSTDVEFHSDGTSMLRVWHKPHEWEQYVIGVDVAKGLTKKDASCASVFRVRLEGSYFYYQMVAQLHGWLNPEAYAIELFKLGLWYNCAPTVIERNGPGDSLIFQMVNTLHAWWLMRDVQNPALMRMGLNTLYGVDTNVNSKGMMISLLQQALRGNHAQGRTMDISCEYTLDELASYVQEASPSGQTYTFKGLGTAHDDRVMSIAVAVYAVKTFPQAYNVDLGAEHARLRSGAKQPEKLSQFWQDVHKELGISTRPPDPLDP